MEMHTDLLKRLVATPSPYPCEEPIQDFIAQLFLKKGYGIHVQHVEGGRANIIVEKGKGKKTVLLYSHLDTVPAVAGWSSDPYRPIIRGDRLYGLGAFDMKGGMAVNIETFLSVAPQNYRLRLVFCVDEENISRGGHALAASPYIKDVEAVLSPEPAFAHGENGIVTGRIGRAVIEVGIRRPSQHFYYYEPQGDISLVASNIILRLQKLYRNRGGKKEFVYVRSMQAKSTGMSTPEEILMELEVSILPPHTPKTFLAAVEKAVAAEVGSLSDTRFEVRLKGRPTPFLAGYELKKNDSPLCLMKKAIRDITGKPAAPYFRSSVADENIFGAAGLSVLGVGPAGGNAHGANEWVSLTSLRNLARIYSRFLEVYNR